MIIGSWSLETRDSLISNTISMEKIFEKKAITSSIEKNKNNTRLDSKVEPP